MRKTKTSHNEPLFARFPREVVERVDAVVARLREADPLAGRSDAIRRLVVAGLAVEEARVS